MSISFSIPKIETPYQIQKDIIVMMGGTNSVGYKRLVKNGLGNIIKYQQDSFVCTLGSGAIFKILTWYPMNNYMKIRIIENPCKPYEKFSSYIYGSLEQFLKDVEVEEIGIR